MTFRMILLMSGDVSSRLREHALALNVPETYHSQFTGSLSILLVAIRKLAFTSGLFLKTRNYMEVRLAELHLT
jgi:hypothetical protein